MELLRVETRTVAGQPDRVRLVANVAYDDRPGASEELWFEVDEPLAGSLSRSGNPWLVLLLPLAATLREPLRLGLPVDALLKRNAAELNAIWRAWYPQLGDVPIESGIAETSAGGRLTGAFFSGGVDSFYTVLRRTEGDAGLRPHELICIAGFDVPLGNVEARRRRRERLARVAEVLETRLVEVATNVKQTRMSEAAWNDLWHGCGVVSSGLALEGRYRRLLIAATFDYGHLQSLGSHPLTDPLLSTEGTRVLHDGAHASRCQKVEFLARRDIALGALHVCWRQENHENCGRCEKCLRTMVMLELAGALEHAGTFPARRLDLDLVGRILLKRERTWTTYYSEISRWAARTGRHDVRRAVESSHRASRLRRRAIAVAQAWKQRRVLWRAARPLQAWAVHGRVT